MYHRVLSLPFVQDDFTFIDGYKNGEIISVHGGQVCYAGLLYIYGMLRIFGENPLPFHIAALLIHFLTCVIIVKFVLEINKNEPLAWCVGFIYAFAGAVHIECLIWAVGIHDLGGMLFFMLAILMFVRYRTGLGAICYLVACLFKEQALVLPLILVFWRWRDTWPYFAMMFVVLLVKQLGASPLGLPPDNPYHISLWGWHIPASIYHYIRYISDVFRPIGIGIIVILLAPIGKIRNFGGGIIAWVIFGIAPATILPNHIYRYYLIYALPAIILLIGEMALQWWVNVFRLKPSRLVVVAIIIIITSIWNIQLVLHGVPLNGGTNNLIQKIERAR